MTTRETVVACLIETARRELGTEQEFINKVKYNHSYYRENVSGKNFKWCVVFLWWCMQRCKVPKEVFPKTAHVFTVRDWYKDRDRYFKRSSTPMPGDLVVFSYSHIGLVIKVTTTEIVTIEGNQDDAVRKVRHNRSESTIDGYCRPAYHLVEVDDVTKEELVDVLRSGFTPGSITTVNEWAAQLNEVKRDVEEIKQKLDQLANR
jgi:signal peptidase I